MAPTRGRKRPTATSLAPARRASKTIEVYSRSTSSVPDRRHRSGYRAGELSDDLLRALDAEVARLEAIPDPIEQTRAVGDAFAALDIELEALADVRLRAISRLRAGGWTYARIAQATGLSDARVAQLARQANAGGRVQLPDQP